MTSVMQHPTSIASQRQATPAPPPAGKPSPQEQPDVYFGDCLAMKVWFGGATLLAVLLLVKELAAVLLPR